MPTIVEDISTNDEDWEGDGIATVNPFRYRGYYYDNETGLYYLQSRYYDPNVGRFVNADSPEILTTSQKNLYTYCTNCPIMFIDSTGFWYYSFYDYNLMLNNLKRTLTYEGRNRYFYNNYLNRYNKCYEQYKYNKKRFGVYYDYINDQNNWRVKNLKFGSDIIKNVGCELIAIYNSLKVLKKWKDFPSVISICYLNNMEWLSGYFGIKPESLRDFFNAYKLKYRYYTNKDNFFKATKNSKVNIVSYWNKDSVFGGLHTVAFVYNKNKSKYTVYNGPNVDYIKKRRFICGYVF